MVMTTPIPAEFKANDHVFKVGDHVIWADDLIDSQAKRARDIAGDGPFQVHCVTTTVLLDADWTLLQLSVAGQPVLHLREFRPISFDPSWFQLIISPRD